MGYGPQKSWVQVLNVFPASALPWVDSFTSPACFVVLSQLTLPGPERFIHHEGALSSRFSLSVLHIFIIVAGYLFACRVSPL